MAWTKVLKTTAFGAAFTISAGTASAFFPPIPAPGEVVTTVPPAVRPPVVVPPIPPVPPPCRDPHQPTDKADCTCGNPGTPQSVPEPATIIATLSGLAALAGWKLRQRSN